MSLKSAKRVSARVPGPAQTAQGNFTPIPGPDEDLLVEKWWDSCAEYFLKKVIVSAPSFQIAHEGAHLTPGDDFSFPVTIENRGKLHVTSVMLQITCKSPYVTINGKDASVAVWVPLGDDNGIVKAGSHRNVIIQGKVAEEASKDNLPVDLKIDIFATGQLAFPKGYSSYSFAGFEENGQWSHYALRDVIEPVITID